MRRLNDGREFEIVKIFHDPKALTERLKKLGWSFEIGQTQTYFLHGVGKRM